MKCYRVLIVKESGHQEFYMGGMTKKECEYQLARVQRFRPEALFIMKPER